MASLETPASANLGGPPPAGPGGAPVDLSMLPHPDLGPGIRSGIWVLTALATIFLSLRVYCKYSKSHRLYWDDWVLIASYICLVTDSILSTVAIGMGFGKHQYDVDIKLANSLATVGLCSVTFAIIGQAWSKTSFALTLLRISDGWMRYFIIFAIVSINILLGIGAMFFWVQCTPLETAWHPLVPGRCWDPHVNVIYGVIASAYSGIMDLALSFLPWKIVLGLQMKKREKFGVAVAMSMGIFAAASAFVKCSALPALLSGDFTYDGASLVLWGIAETAVTIMAASIPVLRVLVRDVATTARYFRSKDTQDAYGSTLGQSTGKSNPRSGLGRSNNTTLVSSGNRHMTSKLATGDDQSDKSILSSEPSPVVGSEKGAGNTRRYPINDGRIMATSEVSVKWSKNSQKGNDGFELEDV